MKQFLYYDTETFGTEDLRKVGSYKYADNNMEIMIVAYALGEQPVQTWDVSNHPEPMPKDLKDAFDNPDYMIIAHNAPFDRIQTDAFFQKIPVERWHCTMAQALSHGLPASLDMLGKVLGLSDDTKKMDAGKKLINKFCKPAPNSHRATRYTKANAESDWSDFVEYARRDVEALREIHKRLPTWNYYL